jgi:intracellular septation protein A
MRPVVLLTQLLPLLVFIVVDALVTDARISILCAVVFALGQLVYTWRNSRRLDWFVVVDVGLIAILGGIAIVFENDQFFKVKPAIVEGISIVLMVALVFAPDAFLIGYLSRNMPSLRPEVLGVMKSMLVWMAFFMGLHVVAVLYTAFRASRQIWAWVSGPGFYLMFVPVVVFVLVRRRRALRRARLSRAPAVGVDVSARSGR